MPKQFHVSKWKFSFKGDCGWWGGKTLKFHIKQADNHEEGKEDGTSSVSPSSEQRTNSQNITFVKSSQWKFHPYQLVVWNQILIWPKSWYLKKMNQRYVHTVYHSWHWSIVLKLAKRLLQHDFRIHFFHTQQVQHHVVCEMESTVKWIRLTLVTKSII